MSLSVTLHKILHDGGSILQIVSPTIFKMLPHQEGVGEQPHLESTYHHHHITARSAPWQLIRYEWGRPASATECVLAGRVGGAFYRTFVKLIVDYVSLQLRVGRLYRSSGWAYRLQVASVSSSSVVCLVQYVEQVLVALP